MLSSRPKLRCPNSLGKYLGRKWYLKLYKYPSDIKENLDLHGHLVIIGKTTIGNGLVIEPKTYEKYGVVSKHVGMGF